MNTYRLLLGTAVALGFCGLSHLGAASDSVAQASASPVPASTAKPARPSISVGMSAEQVQGIIGKPERIKPLKKEGVSAEIWFYSFEKLAGTKDVASSTRDIPVADPITGTIKMIPEAVYTQQRVYVTETTELLMVNGALASSKRYRRIKNSFD
ncbi:MAG: hypothetical protein IPL39_21010 [Opitutaceae bacterium]|nr:hypothetical protein [Opitutaceae bacterium]